MEDLEIILAYREKRHATCFRLLHDRYAAKIYSKALTMLRDQDEAQDATQEIFTKIFLNLGKFQGQSKFSTWVYSVTYNFCIDKIRKEKRSRELFADELENPPDLEADVDDDPELAAMQVNELRTVLSKLGDADRSLLLLKYKDGMKIKDIADLFGKNESAVKMQIMRAKEKAKRIHQDLFAASIK
ncbi:sigma-70 family RNA polymerase sigma factor [Lewinella lacunae]|uniref:Sigma-70 family RNA polymerase sigma factor n=2 Tax=Neolewinella lacunae TaxID=1517758 RepID=A0A923PQZ6_9BACT|nr:sigma-70 family RNA polymerase sigma factor [Neolewinella lacunae]